jgi:aryl-alcohol dehydrogenase-like predicted oxidoreductase
MNRREFLRLGMLGTTGALLGWEGLAEAAQQTAGGPFTFPAPVYRTLGRTGLKITIVSFGAMLTPEPEVIRVAFEHGVNYVDTARRYMNGRNEEIVARALKGMHDKVYVATKIISSSRSKEDIVRDVETSLKALERDHIDVIQLHNVTGRERLFEPEMREALVKLKQQGKVRFFGVTTHTNETEVVNAIVDDKDKFFDTILVKYNFKSGDDLRKAVARAAQSGIGVIAMKTQAGGYTTDALGPISPHQAALKWALQDKSITAAIPGMRDMGHLREDIAVLRGSRCIPILPHVRQMRRDLPEGGSDQRCKPQPHVRGGLPECGACPGYLRGNPLVGIGIGMHQMRPLHGSLRQRP